MIALLLATQIAAAPLAQSQPLDIGPPPRGYVATVNGVLHTLPAKTCPGAGKLETSFVKPTALYRSGDRPPKALRHWADYADPRSCLVETAP